MNQEEIRNRIQEIFEQGSTVDADNLVQAANGALVPNSMVDEYNNLNRELTVVVENDNRMAPFNDMKGQFLARSEGRPENELVEALDGSKVLVTDLTNYNRLLDQITEQELISERNSLASDLVNLEANAANMSSEDYAVEYRRLRDVETTLNLALRPNNTITYANDHTVVENLRNVPVAQASAPAPEDTSTPELSELEQLRAENEKLKLENQELKTIITEQHQEMAALRAEFNELKEQMQQLIAAQMGNAPEQAGPTPTGPEGPTPGGPTPPTPPAGGAAAAEEPVVNEQPTPQPTQDGPEQPKKKSGKGPKKKDPFADGASVVKSFKAQKGLMQKAGFILGAGVGLAAALVYLAGRGVLQLGAKLVKGPIMNFIKGIGSGVATPVAGAHSILNKFANGKSSREINEELDLGEPDPDFDLDFEEFERTSDDKDDEFSLGDDEEDSFGLDDEDDFVLGDDFKFDDLDDFLSGDDLDDKEPELDDEFSLGNDDKDDEFSLGDDEEAKDAPVADASTTPDVITDEDKHQQYRNRYSASDEEMASMTADVQRHMMEFQRREKAKEEAALEAARAEQIAEVDRKDQLLEEADKTGFYEGEALDLAAAQAIANREEQLATENTSLDAVDFKTLTDEQRQKLAKEEVDRIAAGINNAPLDQLGNTDDMGHGMGGK